MRIGTYNKSLLLFVARAAMLIFIVTMTSSFASAHEGELHVEPTEKIVQEMPEPIADAYIYKAQPGDNLTILVRRSVQLYARAKDNKLNPAQIIYAETNVVNELGAKQIDSGQLVRVPFDAVQNYIVKSRELTKSQTMAWNSYAANTNFNLTRVKPANLQAALKATTPRTSSTSFERPEATTVSHKKPTWPWSVFWVSLAAIAAYYMYETRRKSSQSRSKKGTIKRLWSQSTAPVVRQGTTGRTKKGTENTKNKRKRS